MKISRLTDVLLFATLLFLVIAMIIPPEWKIYYDLTTNKTIEIIAGQNPRAQYKSHLRQEESRLRLGFGPIPCSCQSLTCGCCAGMNLQSFNFNRRACLNMTYDPREFAITMDMFMNDESLMSQTISGKNPPPVCLPVPVPYLPVLDFCVRLFNIHMPGYNVFMCVDFETRIQRAPVLILHFDCFQLGQNGFQYHKPDEDQYEEDDPPPGSSTNQEPDVYDEVTEDVNATTTTSIPRIYNSSVVKKT